MWRPDVNDGSDGNDGNDVVYSHSEPRPSEQPEARGKIFRPMSGTFRKPDTIGPESMIFYLAYLMFSFFGMQ